MWKIQLGMQLTFGLFWGHLLQVWVRQIYAPFSFLGLPNLKSFAKNTYRKIEDLVGKHIRQVADNSMVSALDSEAELTQIKKNLSTTDWKKSEFPIGITVSYDMGWNKRSSGKTYDSLSGHALMIGALSKKIVSARVVNKECSTCTQAQRMGTEAKDHECPRNHEGSSKSMEADTALYLVNKLDDYSDSKLYIEAFVTDDDSSIRAMLSHFNP